MIHLKYKNKIKYLTGNQVNENPSIPFDNTICNFLITLSKLIMKNKETKRYPDLVSFAFWCRSSNLLKIKEKSLDKNPRLGRGISFHITPSNLPINSLFSLAFGLLAGNSNIIKLPSKKFKQIDLFILLFKNLTKQKKYKSLKYQVLFIQYESDDIITEYFSGLSNSRLIWGGDNTIQKIKKIDSKPRSIDLSFADRFSIGVLSTEKIISLSKNELHKLAMNFFNDTFIYDQNACSSPHLIVWNGNKYEAARSLFWNELNKIVINKYKITDSMALEKYNDTLSYLIKLKSATLDKFSNNIYCIKLKKLPNKITFLRGRFGIFFEINIRNIDHLKSKIDDKFQTLTYYGVDKKILKNFVINNKLNGIDRIVPVGKALDMDYIWDGIDLTKSLSRIIKVD